VKSAALDAWDWVLYRYTATVILNMSTDEFWKCTPRELKRLMDIHAEVNNPNSKRAGKLHFIDEVL